MPRQAQGVMLLLQLAAAIVLLLLLSFSAFALLLVSLFVFALSTQLLERDACLQAFRNQPDSRSFHDLRGWLGEVAKW